MKNVIPEYATLHAFLLLLFSKCQHSNDVTSCFAKNSKQNKVLSSKNNASGCHRSQNDEKTQCVYSFLLKSSKIIGLLTFGKQK